MNKTKNIYKYIVSFMLLILIGVFFQNCGEFKVVNEISSEKNPDPDPNTEIRNIFWDVSNTRTFVSTGYDSLLAVKDDGNSVATRSIYANFNANSNVWYFEGIVAQIFSGGNRQRFGIAATDGRVPDGTPTASASYGLDFDGSFSVFENGVYSNSALTTALKVSDCIGVLLNLNQSSVEFYVNGVLVKTQNIQSGHSYSPFFFGSNNSNGSLYANFGKEVYKFTPTVAFERIDNSLTPVAHNYGWDINESAAQYISISQNLKTVIKDDGAAAASAATYVNILKQTGKWYFEVEIIEIISGIRNRIGIASTVGRVPLNGNTGSASYGYDFNGSFSKHEDGAYLNVPSIGPALVVGDVVGVAVDHDLETISFYINGTLEHTESFQASFIYSPMFMGANNSNATVNLNLGETRFKYSAPVGFEPSVYY
jgi:hypothetical protein